MVIGKGDPSRSVTKAEIREIVTKGIPDALVSGKRVLVLTPDSTRTCPLPLMIRTVQERVGPLAAGLDYMVALGTHQAMSDEKILAMFGVSPADKAGLFSGSRFLNHRWDLPDTLRSIGTIPAEEIEGISGGLFRESVEVVINRAVFDYDLILILGPVFPHEVVGFSGGNKYLFPGISGGDFVHFFHWLGAVNTCWKTIGYKKTMVRAVVDRAAAQAAPTAAPTVAPAKEPAVAPVKEQAAPATAQLAVAPAPTPAAQAAAPAGQPKPTTHPVAGRENCVTCHQPGGGLKASPADHAGRDSNSCLMCHKAQTDGSAPAAAPPAQAKPAAPVVDPASASEVCRTCHNKPEFDIVSAASSRSDTLKQLDADRSYAHRNIACVTCHSADPHEIMAPVTKTSIADACGKCHVAERTEHISSIHGQSLAAGGRDAATCIDCHSTQNTPHSIARVLSPDSPAYRGSIASTCAKCHTKTDVMDQYGVPTEVYKTYTTTFHGKANILSPYEITQHPKATCVNCHGYHDIKSAADPASPVAPANLANTCGGCHPGAGEQFASGWMGHKEATPQQFPVVYFAERFFFILTSSVLTFGFIFMVALELGSWILRRKSTEH